MRLAILIILGSGLLYACKTYRHAVTINTGFALPQKSAFNNVIDSKQTKLVYLKNKHHMYAAITNYGARLVSLLVPGKNGKLTSVALGFDSLSQYQHAHGLYFGATVGRYANRIGRGNLVIDGHTYQLPLNNNSNTLHGGVKGFNLQVWAITKATDNVVEMTYLSKDGEEGFPGNLSVKVIYQLTDENELKISYSATTDKKTAINLTNHTFFNLNGEGSGTITGHILTIKADAYTPINNQQIPTGETKSVEHTAFDFRIATPIGKHINDIDEQLKYGAGYDHNFILNNNASQFTARVYGPATGILMEVYTTEPGIQFFSGNALKGLDIGRGRQPFAYRTGFCLETQHFPDSPNHNNFPVTFLSAGGTYQSETCYKFSLK